MGDYADEYLDSLGYADENTDWELREAIQNPSAKLVRKNLCQDSPKPCTDKVEHPTVLAPSLIGEIVEKLPTAATVVFNIPKSDILYDCNPSWSSPSDSNDPNSVVKQCDSAVAEFKQSDHKGSSDSEFKAPVFSLDVDELNKKLEWTKNCDFTETDPLTSELGELRFDFNGDLIAPLTYDLRKGVAAALDGELLGLNCHGRVAYMPGYSIPEILTLLTSTSDQQILIALRVMDNILRSRSIPVAEVYTQSGGVGKRLDYAKIHEDSSKKSRDEILATASDYILPSQSGDGHSSKAGYGFGLKRFNEYLFRSLLLHERLVLVAMKTLNSNIVDSALTALADLLVPPSDRLSHNSLQEGLREYLAADDELLSFYLTSRRSVLRRECLPQMLLMSADSDLSDELKFMIAGESDDHKSADTQDDDSELEHRKTDALLSLLLWCKRGEDSEILKLMISRFAFAALDSPVIPSILRIFTGFTLHSSFAANYIHQFLQNNLDSAGSTAIRLLLERFMTACLNQLENASSPALRPGLLSTLTFIRLDSVICPPSNQAKSLLTNGKGVLTIDSIIWNLLISMFTTLIKSPDNLGQLDRSQLAAFADILLMATQCASPIDTGSNLLPIYELVLEYMKDDRKDQVDKSSKLNVLACLLNASEYEFATCDPRSAISFASLLVKGSQQYLIDCFDTSSALANLSFARNLLRLMSTIMLASNNTKPNEDTEYQVFDVKAFRIAMIELFKAHQDCLCKFVENLTKDLSVSTATDWMAAAEESHLMDYIHNLIIPKAVPSTLLLSQRALLLNQFLEFLSTLNEVSIMEELNLVNPLERLVSILRLRAIDICRFTLQFPGRQRFGINTSDNDCFTLSNPLLDPLAMIYCSLRKAHILNKAAPADCAFFSCVYRLSTAYSLRSWVDTEMSEDSWNCLISLACGYCYEAPDDSVYYDVDSANTRANELNAERPRKSQFVATNLFQVFANPFVGRVLYSLGAEYTDVLKQVGLEVLRRSAEWLSLFQLGSIWLYECIETVSIVDLRMDWQELENLQAYVIQHDSSFQKCFSDFKGSLRIHLSESPMMEVLKERWNDLYIDKIRTKLFPAIKGALISDAYCPPIRVAWLWLISNCTLMPLSASAWLDFSMRAMCERVLRIDKDDSCAGIPSANFQFVANARNKEAHLRAVLDKFVVDTTESPLEVSGEKSFLLSIAETR